MTSRSETAEVRRRFQVPAERVFAAFADPQLVARWLSPSPDIRLVVLLHEFHVGGRYRYAYHLPGGEVVHIHGVYRAISPPSRLAFTWLIEPPDEHAGIASVVNVSIDHVPGGSQLVILHERLDRPGSVPRHAEGWAGACDQLHQLLDEVGGGGGPAS